MERYNYLQTLPNSPLTPLTPLSENTKFEFNFGGDGSLDEHIDSVLQEHRVEQQRKKLLQQANQSFQKKLCPPLPRRYSEEFLKIRDVFEDHNHQCKEQNCKKPQLSVTTTQATVVKITPSGTTTPTATISKNILSLDYAHTPTNVRSPLKLKNNNTAKSFGKKMFNSQQQQKVKPKQIIQQQKKLHFHTKENRVFIQASPVAARPLCSQVANILQQCGLTMYYGIFRKEEIDLLAFSLLRLQDLHDLGITNQSHCAVLMESIHYVRQYI